METITIKPFAELEADLLKGTNVEIGKLCTEILTSPDLSDEDKGKMVRDAVQAQTMSVSAKISALPKCILYGTTLYAMPTTVSKNTNGSGVTHTKTQSYPSPFKLGDYIVLQDKGKLADSKVYQIGQAGLRDVSDNNAPLVKASKAVEAYKVTLGWIAQPNFQGFAGTTYSGWRVANESEINVAKGLATEDKQ